eukprot:g24289.t1
MAAWLEEVHDDVLRRIFEFGALVEWQRALQSSWRLWVNTWAYLRRLEELSLTTSDDLRRAGALERVGGLVALERLRVVEVEHCAEAESVLCGFDHLRSLELKECHFLSDAASRYTAGSSVGAAPPQDVPLDDELLVALSAKPLVSLELWSFHGDRWMTSEGVVELARASLRDLRKLSLDSFVFQNSEAVGSRWSR